MATSLFWGSVLMVFYVYILYPLAIRFGALVRAQPIRKAPITPRVSLIIPASNEEENIRQTIENKLALDYPKDKLEIIVVSDGSDDQTEHIVKEYETSGVFLLSQTPRQGKTVAVNLAVQESRGEVLVFSDANSLYERDALRALVSPFADPSVGYVTGRMIYLASGGAGSAEGCSSYMKYENFLRSLESAVGSVVGVDGGIDAVRRSLYTNMRADQLPDLVLPLLVVKKGYRVVYEPSAVLKEAALTAAREEYRMRVRVSLRALHAIFDLKSLLNPVRYGLFSWQLFSHKVLRYMVFIFLAVAYLSNLSLISDAFYRMTWAIQNLLYLGAVLGYLLDKKGKKPGILYLPFYFCLVNAASAHAFWKFVHREKIVTWKPRYG